MSVRRTATASLSLLAATATAAYAGPYEDTVLSFQPTHYYKLDEDQIGTATDSGVGTPITGMVEGSGAGPIQGVAGVGEELALPGFDSDNRALFCNNAGGINLTGRHLCPGAPPQQVAVALRVGLGAG